MKEVSVMPHILLSKYTIYAGMALFILAGFLYVRSISNSCERFEYLAQTLYIHKDHTYRFFIKKINGCYRCYIIRVPQFQGLKAKRYIQGYDIDPKNDAKYIIWNGEKLTSIDSAKNICRAWANANQTLIDFQQTPD